MLSRVPASDRHLLIATASVKRLLTGNGAAAVSSAIPTVWGKPLHTSGCELSSAKQFHEERRPAHACPLSSSEREEFDSLQQQMEGVKQPAAPQQSMKPCKALLVEDDRNECELRAGFLRLAGLEVDTAGDGAEALEYLHTRGQPDVVLLDMVLPRCDGPTTIREIRRDPSCAGLKIFAVTGHSPGRFELDAATSGVDRWFQKPINPQTLLRELDRSCMRGPGPRESCWHVHGQMGLSASPGGPNRGSVSQG
jgi:CheY-like chemotaxis protein